MSNLAREIATKFKEVFKTEPIIVRSPGRINLIGEHTDYNDGFVMPAAIDKEVIFAIAPSANEKSIVHSAMYNEQFEFDLQNPQKVKEPKWANFLLGVLYKLKQEGYAIKPFSCVFGGEVPMGAGLSSSAAIECGFGYALSEVNNLNVPRLDIVRIGQWSEHNFVGVMCGIMDQYASVMGKENHVIVLDCRSLTHRYSPIDLKEYTLILCDTKVKHSLVDSEYNTRRSECETGVSVLKKHHPQIQSLRDVSRDMLEAHRDELKGKVYDRCLYVVQEIERVQQASLDLEKGDLTSFGQKMFETHEGLSELYEVSCKELDFLVNEAKKFKEVLGARMMGGGFGGCTINIVRKDFVTEFENNLKVNYKKAFNIDMPTYKVNIKDGTSIINKVQILSHESV
ncbi:galactokinase [Chryseosolibacter indicus]|uniref:Galactokinase n=1 Tax=Chryseosolibacter indicus TaxID=2782351 RepID=A0ABS5VQ67_9BACT|nr:galactokinase [Chryseosolibacter indicus]MBT1703585.1 galactokinase [Chryseosolibacter indicus]